MERKWDGRTRGGSFGYLFFIRFIEIFGLGPAYFFLCLVVPYFVVFAPAQTRSTFVYSRITASSGLSFLSSGRIMLSAGR